MNQHPVSALSATESKLVANLHAVAGQLDAVATTAVEAALGRVRLAAAGAKERIARAADLAALIVDDVLGDLHAVTGILEDSLAYNAPTRQLESCDKGQVQPAPATTVVTTVVGPPAPPQIAAPSTACVTQAVGQPAAPATSSMTEAVGPTATPAVYCHDDNTPPVGSQKPARLRIAPTPDATFPAADPNDASAIDLAERTEEDVDRQEIDAVQRMIDDERDAEGTVFVSAWVPPLVRATRGAAAEGRAEELAAAPPAAPETARGPCRKDAQAALVTAGPSAAPNACQGATLTRERAFADFPVTGTTADPAGTDPVEVQTAANAPAAPPARDDRGAPPTATGNTTPKRPRKPRR
jgi:hypothetical protein